MYTIVQAPDKILRTPTNPTNLPPEKLTGIISEMKEILAEQKDPEGVGLAANQIGLPYSLFVARFDPKPTEPILVFINPEIISHSEDFQPDNEDKSPLEGCLSLKDYYGVVKRWKWVQVKYQTFCHSGESDDHRTTPESENKNDSGHGQNDLIEKKEKFEGFPATVIQHEMDHLNGKIFVERILEQSGRLYKSTGKTKKGKDIWEEVEI